MTYQDRRFRPCRFECRMANSRFRPHQFVWLWSCEWESLRGWVRSSIVDRLWTMLPVGGRMTYHDGRFSSWFTIYTIPSIRDISDGYTFDEILWDNREHNSNIILNIYTLHGCSTETTFSWIKNGRDFYKRLQKTWNFVKSQTVWRLWEGSPVYADLVPRQSSSTQTVIYSRFLHTSASHFCHELPFYLKQSAYDIIPDKRAWRTWRMDCGRHRTVLTWCTEKAEEYVRNVSLQ